VRQSKLQFHTHQDENTVCQPYNIYIEPPICEQDRDSPTTNISKENTWNLFTGNKSRTIETDATAAAHYL
jgi:hypothetical protein